MVTTSENADSIDRIVLTLSGTLARVKNPKTIGGPLPPNTEANKRLSNNGHPRKK